MFFSISKKTSSRKARFLILTLNHYLVFIRSGFGLKRCMAYQVNYDAKKKWQWFDVLPPYLEIQSFPQFIQSAFSFS